jgi:hypothetical protein
MNRRIDAVVKDYDVRPIRGRNVKACTSSGVPVRQRLPHGARAKPDFLTCQSLVRALSSCARVLHQLQISRMAPSLLLRRASVFDAQARSPKSNMALHDTTFCRPYILHHCASCYDTLAADHPAVRRPFYTFALTQASVIPSCLRWGFRLLNTPSKKSILSVRNAVLWARRKRGISGCSRCICTSLGNRRENVADIFRLTSLIQMSAGEWPSRRSTKLPSVGTMFVWQLLPVLGSLQMPTVYVES